MSRDWLSLIGVFEFVRYKGHCDILSLADDDYHRGSTESIHLI